MTTAVEIAERGHHLAAWVNFNGTLDENSGGLTAGENVLIRASYNVSSCQFNGTGDYTINFATAMPDANYVVTTERQRGTGSDTAGYGMNLELKSLSTSSFGIAQEYYNGSAYDAATVCVAIFR